MQETKTAPADDKISANSAKFLELNPQYVFWNGKLRRNDGKGNAVLHACDMPRKFSSPTFLKGNTAAYAEGLLKEIDAHNEANSERIKKENGERMKTAVEDGYREMVATGKV